MDEHLTMVEQLLVLMKKRGGPVTRANYPHLALFGDIPDP